MPSQEFCHVLASSSPLRGGRGCCLLWSWLAACPGSKEHICLIEQRGEVVANPAACNGIAENQVHHQNKHSSSHSEQQLHSDKAAWQTGTVVRGTSACDFASGAQIQPDLAFSGPQEPLSSPEIATEMMLSAAGDDDAKILVIQQEQLDLWQLSLQLLRDAGMGRPAARSQCNPWVGEMRCPALPAAATAMEGRGSIPRTS